MWQTGICKMWRHLFQKFCSHRLPVVKKRLFFPPHADDLLACCVMWHFITKMDSHIPQGFSGFLPEILTAFCQFMAPTSHFSTVAKRQETFNLWVWLSLALSLSHTLSFLIFCTVLPLKVPDKHDRNVTSPPLPMSLRGELSPFKTDFP